MWSRLFGMLAAGALTVSCLRPPDPRSAAAEAQTQGSSRDSAGGSVETEAYDWKSVVIMGGGFVTGLLYSPVEAGILYARTDIGGVYRHDPKQQSWVPLLDFLGNDDAHYLGIESFAADPVKANRVYMAVGMYTAEWAKGGAFMRSDDRGDTWKVFPAPVKMGGNDLSRSDGERLAVDPNKPNVLYFGSRRNGLWRSEDEAETWQKVESFPADDDREKGLGLPFVVFDRTTGKPGQPTPAIYVGDQKTGGIYRSLDAGKTWKELPSQPKDFPPRRAVFDSDGTLYVTYALGDSPYALTNGAVFRFEPKQDKWTNITPLKPSAEDTFGYGGVAVDPSNPGTVVTTTMDRWTKGAEIFRSRDRGKTWKPLAATATFDGGSAKHVYHHREKLNAPQWMGDIKIDPFNANRAMIIEGGGVWETSNLGVADSDQPTRWSFHSKNLEETVARDIVSPPKGAQLLSVMLDACGFRHDDLNVSPQRGTFRNPACASAEDIDFAEAKPDVVARVGAHPWDGTKGPRGALSIDGGATWKQFESEPAGSAGLGSVALSADGKTLLWAPREAQPAYSRDGGKTWKTSTGLPAPKKSPDWAPWFVRLASDRVNANKFYVYDALEGAVFVSDDGGANFKQTTYVNKVPEYELQFGSIKTVAGHEGEVWITTKKDLSRSSDSGKTFSAVDGIGEAHGVGFGRPAPGKTFPAIYLSGTLNGVTGFFRSDDVAENFVRINDDQHRYGGAQIITGDPRVYGRVYVAPAGRGIIYGEPLGASN